MIKVRYWRYEIFPFGPWSWPLEDHDHDHEHDYDHDHDDHLTIVMKTMMTWKSISPWKVRSLYFRALKSSPQHLSDMNLRERGVSSFGFFSLWIWMCDHTHCNCHKVSSFMTLVEPNGFLFHIWLCVCVSPSHASSRLNFGCKFCDLARCWPGRGHHSRGVTPNRHF